MNFLEVANCDLKKTDRNYLIVGIAYCDT